MHSSHAFTVKFSQLFGILPGFYLTLITITLWKKLHSGANVIWSLSWHKIRS